MNPANLFRSGWWVLVAGVVVSIVFAVGFILMPVQPATSPANGAIALEPCIIDDETLVKAMAQDGLKSLMLPATMTPQEVDHRNENERGKLLVSTDRIIGIEIAGEARAYPLRLLRWHEAINDVVGGRAIAVTYSPLSGGISIWDRVIDGKEFEFAVSGWLHNSNTLLYDRRGEGATSSLWHQLTGEAVTGPAAGKQLSPFPAELSTWANWRRDHPETTVMAPDAETKRKYKRDPYHSYRGSDVLRFPVEPLAPEGALAHKALVAIVTHGGRDAVFALPYLEFAVGANSGKWAALLDEDVFLIDYDVELGTFAIKPREDGVADPPVRFAYWFEWYSLHPEAGLLP
jgi:Protein of unknown function (DUF3179)